MRTLALSLGLLLAAPIASAQSRAAQNPGDEPASVGPRPATDPEEEQPGDEAPAPSRAPTLPPPTLEDPVPIAPAEPIVPDPDPRPEVLTHIGTGDHPEWEDPEEEAPPDIPFEVPGDVRSTNATATHRPGLELRGQEPEEPPPPLLLSASAGSARFLGTTPLDFFRVEEHFEGTVPGSPILRLGAGASQNFAGDSYLVGGGARIGMGVPFCHNRRLTCEGLVLVQPGFLVGLSGPVFDLNASLTLRLIIGNSFVVEANGGYSFLVSGSLLHVTGGAGFVF